MLDKIKLVIAAALAIGGIWVYYQLSDDQVLWRVLAMFGGLLAACAVAWLTEPGRKFVAFAREAIIEAKKVVWPTRKETLQTTAAVFAFAVAMAVFLWISDKGLEWVLYDVILGWKKT